MNNYQIKRYCAACGRVHSGQCEKRINTANYHRPRDTQADKFRGRQAWKRCAVRVMQRDMYCCRVCLAAGRIVNRGLSVHHIVPLAEDYDKRLDEDNLITLCSTCHSKAESGGLPRAELLALVHTPLGVDLIG